MNREEIALKIVEMLIGSDTPVSIEPSNVESGYGKYLGKNVFIRTVTHHYTGNVTHIDNLSLTLEDAAWIPDDGRLSESLKNPDKFEEVEPFLNPVSVNLYSLLDITEIPKLITKVK